MLACTLNNDPTVSAGFGRYMLARPCPFTNIADRVLRAAHSRVHRTMV